MCQQESRYCPTFGPEYHLVTDSQEVAHIMRWYVKSEDFDDYASLFVKVGDGEYLELWGSESSIAYNHILYYRIPLAF